MGLPELAVNPETTQDTPDSKTHKSIIEVPECEPDKGIYLDGKEIYDGKKLTELNPHYFGHGLKWIKEIDILTRDCEDLEALLKREGLTMDDIIQGGMFLVNMHQQKLPYDADVLMGAILRGYEDHMHVDIGWKNGLYIFSRCCPGNGRLIHGAIEEITADQIINYRWIDNDAHRVGSHPSYLGISSEAYEFFVEHPKFGQNHEL